METVENLKSKYEEFYFSKVSEAKGILKKIKDYKRKVAIIALEVCDIRHGGISHNIYTITDFASDIGMNRKTLSEWIQTVKIERSTGIKIPEGKIKETRDSARATGIPINDLIQSDPDRLKDIVTRVIDNEEESAVFKTLNILSNLRFIIKQYDLKSFNPDNLNKIKKSLNEAIIEFNEKTKQVLQ